jgi:group I intron endonuclease
MKKISGIYAITNEVSNRAYIGSSKDVLGRWSNHKSNLKNNKHKNKLLQNDYNNQSINDFTYTFLEECLQRDLPTKEKLWKDNYKDNIYNVRDIVSTHKQIRRGREAKAFKEKFSVLNQGEKNPNCSKFNETSIKEVRRLLVDGEPLEEIAARYHTTVGYIYQIKNKRKWKHVDIDNNKCTGGNLLI